MLYNVVMWIKTMMQCLNKGWSSSLWDVWGANNSSP